MGRDRFTQGMMLAAVVTLIAGAGIPAGAAGLPNTPLRVQALPGTGAVLIGYGGVLNAAGYNVYRRGASQAADQAVKVNAEPTRFTWLVDDGQGQGLANGTPLLYFVKAVGADGAEGPASAEVVVTPQVPLLDGMYAYDIGTTFPSTVTLEGTVLTISASGHELWDQDDGGTFVGRPVSGDYSVSAKLLEKQTGGHPSAAKAGVMIREGLNPGDRYAIAAVLKGRGVLHEGRLGVLGAGDPGTYALQGTDNDATTFPIWLKLTKTGAMISGFQSTDGTNYEAVGEAQEFFRMQGVTYAGLGLSAVHVNNPDYRFITAKFDATSIKIEQ